MGPVGCLAEVDPTEASIAPARGGDRTRRPPHRTSRVPPTTSSPAARGAAGAAALATLVVLVLGPMWSGPAGGAVPPAVASASSGDALGLTLVRQSPWVGPDPGHQDLALGLRVTGTAPRAGLHLTVTVYDALTTRSGFTETLSGHGLGGVLAQSPALALGTLATDAQGVTALTIPVAGDSAPPGPGDWTAHLGCRTGGCAGVYPVAVTVAGAGAGSSAQLVTYLVYDDPSLHAQPLRFALVVPLALAAPVAGSRGRPTPPGAGAVARFDGLVGELAGTPAVPLTVEPDPATLQALAAAGHSRSVAAVAALAAEAGHETLSSSFVPVDPTALVDAGLADEVSTQLRRGGEVLATPAVAVRATTGTWVAASALDQATIDLLAPQDPHVVVPASAVGGPTGPLTTTQPFTLTAGRGAAVTAAVADPTLGAHLVAAEGRDPALAAEQLLADLSLVYDEAPNLLGPQGAPATRGLVAAAPIGWAPGASFVTALLSGLRANPVVQPVTLDQLFAQVPVGEDGQADTRRPLAPGAASVPARALRAARGRVQGFESAAGGSARGAAVATGLDDLVLAAEARTLTTRQQAAALRGFTTALDDQLHLLSVRTDTIRLTASAANVPITLVRGTPYPVTVTVSLTSDKLRFPAAAQQAPGALCRQPQVTTTPGRSSFSALCTLDRPTDTVYVSMRARTAGDFRIDVSVASPRPGLVLAGGELTVRSLSTSAVAIALSAVAAAVLVAWWARTLWRARWARRGAHSAAGGGSRA